MCFMLQGGFAALIIYKYTSNRIYSIIGSIFASTSIIMTFRMFGHTALAGHFIILVTIYIYIMEKEIDSKVKKIVLWSLVCSCAMLIHPYFICMVGVILLGNSIRTLISNKKDWMFSIIRFIIPTIITTVFFYIVGGFQNIAGGKIEGGMLGEASLNLNGFFNPFDKSSIFSGFNSAPISFAMEGLNYLGVGIICLLPFIVIVIVKYLKSKDNKNKKETVIPIVIMVMILFVLSISPKVYFGSTLIFNYTVPDTIYSIWNIFQSTGRLIWPVYYATSFACIISLYKVIKKNKFSLLILTMLLLLQMFEYKDYFYNLYTDFRSEYNSESSVELKNTLWDDIFDKCGNVMFIYPYEINKTLPFMIKGTTEDLNLNAAYLARCPMNNLLDYTSSKYDSLIHGEVDNDTAYVFITNGIERQAIESLPLDSYDLSYIDNYLVLTAKGVIDSNEYKEEISKSKTSISEYCEDLNLKSNEVLYTYSTLGGMCYFNDEIIGCFRKIGLFKTNKVDYVWDKCYISCISNDGLRFENIDSNPLEIEFDEFEIKTCTGESANNGTYDWFNAGLIKNGSTIWRTNSTIVCIIYNEETKMIQSITWFNSDQEYAGYTMNFENVN